MSHGGCNHTEKTPGIFKDSELWEKGGRGEGERKCVNRDKRGMMTRRKGTKDCQISHLLHISVRQVKLNDVKK